MATLALQRLLLPLCVVCLSCSAQAQESLSIGTATSLNKSGDLLTNRHVVDGCTKLIIRTRNNVFYNARVVAESNKFDLAVISATGYTPEATVSLSVNPRRYVYIPTPGMRLMYGGFDLDPVDLTMPVDISNGEALEASDDVYVSRMRSGADHGSSGSGVFDNSGNIVGVIFSGYIDANKHTTENYYGFNVINFYNNNAVVEFLQKELSIELAYSVNAEPISRVAVVGTIFASTVLVVCEREPIR